MSEVNIHQEQQSAIDRNSLTGSSGPYNLNGPKQRYKPVRIKALLDALESDDDDTEPRDSDNDSDTEDLEALPEDNDSICDLNKKNHNENRAAEMLQEVTCDENIVNNVQNYSDKLCITQPGDIEEHGRQIPLPLDAVQVTNVSVPSLCADKVSELSFPKHLSNDKQHPKCTGTIDAALQMKQDSYMKEEINEHVQTDKKLDVHQPMYNFTLKEVIEKNHLKNIQQMQSNDPTSEKHIEDMHSDMRYQAVFLQSAMETPLKHLPQISYRPNPCLSHKKLLSTPQTRPLGDHVETKPETPGVILSNWSRHNLFQTPTQNSILSNKDCMGYMTQPQQNLHTPRYCASEANRTRKPLMEANYLNQCFNANESQKNYMRQHSSSVKHSIHFPPAMECDYDVPGNSHLAEHDLRNTLSSRTNNDKNEFLHSLQDNRSPYDKNFQVKSDFPPKSTNANWHENVENRNSNIHSDGAFHVTSKEQPNYESSMNKNCDYNSRTSSEKLIVNPERCNKKLLSEDSSELQSHLESNHLKLHSRNSTSALSLPKSDNSKIDSQLSVNEVKPSKLQESKTNPKYIQCSVASSIPQDNQGKTIAVKDKEYLILGKLGQGMSGEVLRVQDMSTSDLRAIKCVNLSRIDKETAQGCLEEVSLLHRLQAPCIITMYTYEIKADMLYVVMEMGDTDLNRLLKSMLKEKQLPLTMILYYWTEMLTAVKHIHDNGVIHSDLKPANFLLVRGRLKLIDFGIASSVNADMTSVVKSSSLGTLNYISPEAIMDIGGDSDSPTDDNKYKINYKSDVWSLGCILYSLVYGQTPFQHIRADWAKVNAITNPKPKIAFAPTENLIRCGYTPPPPFLVDVMRQCLQHNPKARPTVSQLLDISYVGCGCNPVSSLPKISPTILAKIKPALDENEWRQLLEVLERTKPV